MTKEAFLALDPCQPGIEYVNGFPSVREAWDNCKSTDNMLWLAGHFPACRDNLVIFAEECACIALAHAATNVNCDIHGVYAAARYAARAENAYGADAAEYAADAAAHAADFASNAANAGDAERRFQVKRIRELFTDIIFND